MKITKCYLTKNDVYVNNLGRIDSRYTIFQDKGPQGVMLHSVGYAQPEAKPIIQSWNRPGKEKAVHGFIETDTIYQTLPWNYRGWHAGGSANNTHIGIEMCEPKTIKYIGGSSWVDLDPTATEAFVKKTYANAVELFASLCKQFKLDPLADGVIISHTEGYKHGIASNHGDPEHIWNKFGLSMDTFRSAVAEKLQGDITTGSSVYRVCLGTYSNVESAQKQALKLIDAGFNVRILDDNGTEVALHRIGTVKVSSSLNIRSGPSTTHNCIGRLYNGDKVVVVKEQGNWGKLQQGGWICLDYITKGVIE